MNTTIRVICALLLFGWVILGLYLRTRLRHHGGSSRSSLQEQAHQVWKVAQNLAETVKNWPACLHPEKAASNYIERIDEACQGIDSDLEILPRSLTRPEADEPALGHDAGATVAAVSRPAGQRG